MTAQEFIDWLQTANNLPNPTQAVKRAAQMMRVTEDTIWKWLNTKKSPEYMQLLMELLHEKYREKRFHRILSHEQREEMRSMLGQKPDGEIAELLGIARITVYNERYKLGIKKYCSPESIRIQHDEEFIAVLGKIPDSECAKKFGYSYSKVAYIRKKLGIKAYRGPRKPRGVNQKPRKPYKPRDPNKPCKKKEYPEELINMLGKTPDDEIAKKFGYSKAGIALIRKKMGIPSCYTTRFPEEKREETMLLFGKLTDREISEKLEIPVGSVVYFRKKLKIAPVPQSPIKDADKDMILDLLGRVSDLKIAKKTGYSVYTIKKFREQHKINPFNKNILERFPPDQRKKLLSMLGKVYDRVIAEKFNIDDEVVRRIRKKMHVPALREEKSLQETIEGDEYIKSLLGTMTDKEVANKTGKSIQVIGKARRKLNIPSFDTRGRSKKKQA